MIPGQDLEKCLRSSTRGPGRIKPDFTDSQKAGGSRLGGSLFHSKKTLPQRRFLQWYYFASFGLSHEYVYGPFRNRQNSGLASTGRKLPRMERKSTGPGRSIKVKPYGLIFRWKIARKPKQLFFALAGHWQNFLQRHAGVFFDSPDQDPKSVATYEDTGDAYDRKLHPIILPTSSLKDVPPRIGKVRLLSRQIISESPRQRHHLKTE